MKDEQKSRLREYAWKYFEFHATQRLKTFHLYLMLVGADIAAFTATIKITSNYNWYSIYGILLIFLSIVFGKLDIRNKQLVKNGEAALYYLDEQEDLSRNGEEPNVLEILAHDDFMMKKMKNDTSLGINITYSKFLMVIFRTIGFVGLVQAIVCFLI